VVPLLVVLNADVDAVVVADASTAPELHPAAISRPSMIEMTFSMSDLLFSVT
jgi:hypothetical protein